MPRTLNDSHHKGNAGIHFLFAFVEKLPDGDKSALRTGDRRHPTEAQKNNKVPYQISGTFTLTSNAAYQEARSLICGLVKPFAMMLMRRS